MTGLEMARELLTDAEVCWQNGRYRSAVSRSYYAVYHAAITLFEHFGYHYSRFKGRGGGPARRWEHKLITVNFPIEFTQKRSVLEWRVSIDIRELYSARLTADYQREVLISQAYAERRWQQAQAIVEQIEEIMQQ